MAPLSVPLTLTLSRSYCIPHRTYTHYTSWLGYPLTRAPTLAAPHTYYSF